MEDPNLVCFLLGVNDFEKCFHLNHKPAHTCIARPCGLCKALILTIIPLSAWCTIRGQGVSGLVGEGSRRTLCLVAGGSNSYKINFLMLNTDHSLLHFKEYTSPT